MFCGDVGLFAIPDTDPFYVLMTPGGELARIKATSLHDEFNEELWTDMPMPFVVTDSIRMWYSTDDKYIERINSGASALVNSLVGSSLRAPKSIYGCVVFTGAVMNSAKGVVLRGLSLADEALVGVYAKLVREMESAYSA